MGSGKLCRMKNIEFLILMILLIPGLRLGDIWNFHEVLVRLSFLTISGPRGDRSGRRVGRSDVPGRPRDRRIAVFPREYH